MGHRWNGDNPFSTSKCYYEEWFKTPVKFITPSAETRATTLEHTWRIEDGVSLLQLFSCNQEEADRRIALYASKSSGNVVIVDKDTDFLMLLIYSIPPVCGISEECVEKYDTNSYANIGTI